MTGIKISETTTLSHPAGSEVLVEFVATLTGHVNPNGSRQAVVRWTDATAVAEALVDIPPAARVSFLVSEECTCSAGHRTKMRRYNQPHGRGCPLRREM